MPNSSSTLPHPRLSARCMPDLACGRGMGYVSMGDLSYQGSQQAEERAREVAPCVHAAAGQHARARRQGMAPGQRPDDGQPVADMNVEFSVE